MELAPCLADRLVCLPPQEERGFLDRRRSGVHDVDAHRLPASLPPVWDAHVHLFPDRLFAALRAWFERHAWPVRYPLNSPEVIDFLLACGVERLVALHYAHKPGISRDLNRYMAELCRDRPEIVGTATVFPGEPESRAILEEAFGLGLRGVKLHCHVQCFAPDEEEVEEVYRACADHRVPLVMHAGREPKSPAYACDPHLLCSADRLEAVLRSYPDLTLVVPHLGADEFDAYACLLYTSPSPRDGLLSRMPSSA